MKSKVGLAVAKAATLRINLNVEVFGKYRAQTGIWRLLGFVSARTIKGRSS